MKPRLFLLALLANPILVHAQNSLVSVTNSGNADKRPISSLLDKFEVATCHRDTKAALALIDKGLNTKEVDEYGNSALALAARFGMFDVVKALVAHGADIHLRVGNDTILGFAIGSRSVEEVAFLLAHGVGANEPLDDNNRTPLMDAASFGQMDIVTLLLAQGADVQAYSLDVTDALGAAAVEGHADVAGLLIEHGADPNRPGMRGEMPLNWAARAGYLDTVKMLVQKGAVPEVSSGPDQMTPVAAASCRPFQPGRDDVGVIQFLLQHGAKASTPARHGATPLMLAALTYARPDIIKALIVGGADMHSPDGEGAKAFRQALQQNRPNSAHALKALLDAGANPNWQVQNNYSALFYSIQIRPNAETVAALVEAKADVNATHHEQPVGEFVGGRPPDYVYNALIAAVKTNSVSIVKILLEAGANAQYKDSEGKTALDRGREENNSELVALLAKYS